ncbi:recombinase [Kosakonia phage Kc166B]|nr:recombinase [Kosakonia phage Kc166B]
MQMSSPCDLVVPAFLAARENMANVKKNAQNPHLKNNYANLEAFLAAIRPALEANELVIVQSERVEPGNSDLILETCILHKSGQYIAGEMSMPVAKKDAQGKGSALTYCRRYAISAMFGIAQADDDGNAARLTAKQAIAQLEAEQFENVEDLKAAAREVYKRMDRPSQAVLTNWITKEEARLTVANAAGFNPSAPIQRDKKEAKPANAALAQEPQAETKPGDF